MATYSPKPNPFAKHPQVGPLIDNIQRYLASLSDTGWIAPTFTNSWAQQASRIAVGYRKIGSVVYLRGSLWGGVSGTSAFTLNSGFRPSNDLLAAGGYYGPDTGNSVLITSTGTVNIYWTTASQAALDGISFLID